MGNKPTKLVRSDKAESVGVLRRKRADSLHWSQATLQAIIEKSPDYFLVLDREFRVQYINHTEPGLSREDLIGQPLYIFVEKRDQARVREHLETAIRTGESQPYETQYQHADGTIVLFESVATPLPERGDDACLVVTARDITKRKLSEEHYRQLIEGTSNLVTQVDAAGRFIFVNHAAKDVYGMEPDECIGVSAFDFVHPDDRERTRQWFDSCIRNRRASGSIDNRQVSRAGEVRHLIWTANFKYDRSGAVVEASAIGRDVTDRKRVEEALRRSEKRYILAQRAANIGSWDWDIVTGELKWSDRFEPMFGLPPGRFAATYDAFLECIHPDDRQLVVDAVEDAVEGRKPYDIEHRIVWPDGTVHWISDVGSVTRDDRGDPIRMYGIVQDITRRKDAEGELARHRDHLEELVDSRTADLRNSQKLLAENEKLAATGRMAARVAHEINNPLAGIRNAFRVLQETVPPDLPTFEYFGLIYKEIDRIAKIVGQMIDLHRPLHHLATFVSVNATVREVVAMLDPVVRKHRISVEIDIAEPASNVRLPESALRQILYNLLANAAEASPTNGTVTISATQSDHALQITVSDQGQGIAEEHRSRVFEPFFTTKEAGGGGGLGLGLSICRGIAESLGAVLEFESPPEGGCLFRFVLPLKKTPEG